MTDIDRDNVSLVGRKARKKNSPGEVYVVGITGGIACGKSRVARYISKRLAALSIDADVVCRKLLQPYRSGWKVLQQDKRVPFEADGVTIDRAALRKKIFHDHLFRDAINTMLHPLVLSSIQKQIAQSGNSYRCILVEVPLLFEAGWQQYFHRVITVSCSPENAVSRLVKRDGCSRDEAQQALATHFPNVTKVEAADCSIDNNGEWGNVCVEIDQLVKKIKINLDNITLSP